MALPFLFSDNASSTIGAPLSLGGTTITLASGGGARFPSPGPGQQFALTINDQATQVIFEVVWCTARAGDVLTVIRGQEGTTAKAWSVGDYVWNGPTSGTMQNLVQTPHMVDASIAPVFSNTQVNGTLGATGAAAFSSTGSFGSSITVTDPNAVPSGGVIINNAGSQGARIALRGSGGATGTPNKYIRAINGGLDVVNSAYSGTILSLSDVGDLGAIRNLTASGTGSFTGAVTSLSNGAFTDTGSTNGVFINGANTTVGANLRLHTANGEKYVRQLNNRLEVVNSGYTGVIFTVDDAGNISNPGAAVHGGAVTASAVAASGLVSGLSVQSNSGNVTAFGGRLRATFGARGSGDANAATLLTDFVFGGSYQIFPNGLILQWGTANIAAVNPQSEGGFSWFFGTANVTFPTTFPNGVLSITTGAFDINGHLVVNANPANWTSSGTQLLGHCSIQANMAAFYMAIGT